MDAKKSDHAYPKHRHSSPDKQGPVDAAPPMSRREQHDLSRQASRRNVPAKAGYSVGLGKDLNSDREVKPRAGKAMFASALDHAHEDHTYLNSSQHKTSLAASGPRGVPITATSSAQQRVKRRKAKKQNNRDTDHMYNTRRTEGSGTVSPDRQARNTDHLYNLRKVDVPVETSVKRPNNRDTDHLYNLQTSKTPSHEARPEMTSASGRKGAGRGGAHVDKRVVDRDHMYQHNSRKTRGRVHRTGPAGKRKRLPPEVLAGAAASPRKRRAVPSVPESLEDSPVYQAKRRRSRSNAADVSPTGVSRTVSAASARTVTVKSELSEQTVVEEPVYGDRVCTVTLQGEMVAHPLSEHGYTSVPCRGSGGVEALSCSAFPASTTPSTTPSTHQPHSGHTDDDGGRVCADDSDRCAGSHSHIDHMYVHADYLDRDRAGGSKVLAGEGCRQEHSYAYSEEIRYDACKDCSQLVQQLISTIRQQKDHIEELKTQLQVTQAKNKLLSTMFSNQLEDGH